MRTITFYSYKGGVGRTLALARTATILADAGKKVFVLDLDLEAPGLHFKLLNTDEPSAGFVELARIFVKSGFLPESIAGHSRLVPNKRTGSIRLMPAGTTHSNDYWTTLTELGHELFDADFANGVPMLLELKQAIKNEFSPDVLLIDARTGITEVGGIALTLLPDDVVCLFSYNRESLWGTRAVIRAIPRTQRRPPGASPLPKVNIIPVLTRFPADSKEDEVLDETHRYLNEPAAGEQSPDLPTVFILHSDRETEIDEGRPLSPDDSLARDYFQLFTNGLKLSEAGLVGLELKALIYEKDWRGALDLLLQEPSSAPEQLATALAEYNRDYSSRLDHESAVPLLQRVFELNNIPENVRSTAAQYLAVALAKLGRFEEISPGLLQAALGTSDDDDTTLDQLGQLSNEYLKQADPDGAPLRHDTYETVATNLARRLEVTGDAPGAEEVLEKAAKYFSRTGSPRCAVALYLRQAEFFERSTKLERAETSLRDAATLVERIPPGKEKHDTLNDIYARLVAILGAQRKPEAAAAVRHRLERRKKRSTVARPNPPKTLPTKRHRFVRGSSDDVCFQVPIRVVTPILGGAAETRKIDQEDVIRAPSIRGQLRFWWRALHGGGLEADQLYARERELWGGAADDAGGRSTVEVNVQVTTVSDLDHSELRVYGAQATPGAYALWPARGTKGTRDKEPQPPAERRKPGTEFVLTVSCRSQDEAELRTTIRAFILFGGYGSRTRRGCGSLTVAAKSAAESNLWLPGSANADGLLEAFGRDVFKVPDARLSDLPLLAGAALWVGRQRQRDAMGAWDTALKWLSDFRQAQPPGGGNSSNFAREGGADQRRPGRSNWPEADKVRQLSGRDTRWAHEPRHNDTPVWPRAGFGLPIVGQFQRMDRNRQRYRDPEPRDFELRFQDSQGNARNRLASPLIVKALPLASGEFVPCALWLYRGYPRGEKARVILDPKDSRSRGSGARFDMLVAPGDKALYAPLEKAKDAPEGMRLRTAFFDWLSTKAEVVAP